jgi:hypothetical protein
MTGKAREMERQQNKSGLSEISDVMIDPAITGDLNELCQFPVSQLTKR